MKGDRQPKRLGLALDRLLGSMRAPSIDVLDAVFSRWDEIVGPDLARHTTPASIDDDRLVVTADDPTWASEFAWLENEVVARVEQVSGSARIKRVTVRVRGRD